MASLNYLQDKTLVSFLSQINQTKDGSEETIKQTEIYSEDMSEGRREAEEDQISSIETNNSIEKTGIVGGNNQYVNEKSSIQQNIQQQNTDRTVGTNNSSNRDSGISGSSNESISQIPSPVEEEKGIKEEKPTNATFNSK